MIKAPETSIMIPRWVWYTLLTLSAVGLFNVVRSLYMGMFT